MTPNGYVATTEDITVIVRPIYLDGQSDAIAKKFVFLYFVRIENHSHASVKLLRRHWYIHDATGEVKEVEGEGVVGKQPLIRPGGSHEYSSYAILETFEGYMEGSYLMQREEAGTFDVKIPRFTLRAAAN